MPSLSVLTQEGGFWAQAFGTPARAGHGKILAARPTGNLGPRYLVAYRVPSSPETSSVIWQVLYPYAAKPVSHMATQPLWGRIVPGGWYRLGPGLRSLLREAGLPATAPVQRSQNACPVTTSALPSRRYGSSGLWVTLPPGGILRVRRNQPDDGTFGTKLGWIPDRDRGVRLTVGGRRLDAAGRMIVRGVFWGHSSTGKGSWASPVAFPQAGCWRITGRAGPTTVSYVVRVVPAHRPSGR